MPRDPKTKAHYAETEEEGQLYLPQVSFVCDFSEGGAAIYSVSFRNLHTNAQDIILKLKKGETVSRYGRDGSDHQNRDIHYPSGGTYKEYTVETTNPILDAKGKRITSAHRIIHRTDTNEFFYTGFHYADPHKVMDVPA
jgi:guanyl-specific ribonuclease Sa